jgi:hypothetical protein
MASRDITEIRWDREGGWRRCAAGRSGDDDDLGCGRRIVPGKRNLLRRRVAEPQIRPCHNRAEAGAPPQQIILQIEPLIAAAGDDGAWEATAELRTRERCVGERSGPGGNNPGGTPPRQGGRHAGGAHDAGYGKCQKPEQSLDAGRRPTSQSAARTRRPSRVPMWDRRRRGQPLAMRARSIASTISILASAASPQPSSFTHLPGSRSL